VDLWINCYIDILYIEQFALRWRTEDEVVAGIGESSCANTRCKRHDPSSLSVASRGALHTLELPFGYVEEGQVKSALVKVVLCDKCVKKIMWKRMQEKNAASGAAIAVTEKGEEEMKQKQRAVGEKGAENNDGDTKIYNDAPSDSDLDEEEDERKGNSGSSFKEENRRLAVERQKESDGEAKREREPKRDSEREVRHSELRHLGHHDSHRRRRNYPKGYKSRRKEEGGRRRHSRSRSPNRDDRNRAKGNNK
jgi:protein FRA10AC1